MTSPSDGLQVSGEVARGYRGDLQEWFDSAVFAVNLLQRTLGRADLDGVEVLDVGCGTKVTKALLDRGEPIGRYVGVDVSTAVIDWLHANVSDPRFEYHHLDAHNDLYNPTGIPLDEFDHLPVDGRSFDLICLFSVFTHLAPSDYVAMLRLLRRHAKPDGRLLFTLFMKEPHDSFSAALEARLASSDPAVAEQAQASLVRALANPDRGFVDAIPDRPLEQAWYNKDYALRLIEGTGWEVMSLHPPERRIQHYMICRPI